MTTIRFTIGSHFIQGGRCTARGILAFLDPVGKRQQTARRLVAYRTQSRPLFEKGPGKDTTHTIYLAFSNIIIGRIWLSNLGTAASNGKTMRRHIRMNSSLVHIHSNTTLIQKLMAMRLSLRGLGDEFSTLTENPAPQLINPANDLSRHCFTPKPE